MQSKDVKQWVIMALLGGSGMSLTTLGVKAHYWIDEAWKPYKIENEKRLEEQRHTRHEMERLNYSFLVVQYQLTGMKLEEAIEAVNEELHD